MRSMRRGLLLALVAAVAGSAVLTGATASAERDGRQQPYVWGNVATGGGGYVREENRRAIASLGTAVFLDVPLTVLLERLADKTDRPLFESAEQAGALAAEREPFYRMGSIPVALRLESPEEAADRVLLALDAKKRPRLFEP